MKAKKVMMTVLAAVSVLSMSANVMAAGSITNAVDTNKVTASTVTKKIVGDKTEIATEDVDVKLEEVEADTFETDIQKEVDILNQSDADTIVESAFETVFGVENIPQVDFYEAAAYGHFPRPSGPRSPARQGHIKRPVLRLAEPSFLRPANQCC